MIRLISRYRRSRFAGENGSLPLAFLLIIVGSGLAAAMVPILISTIHSTSFDNSRVRELNAAETGVNVALGTIRAASVGGAGDVTKLPCTTASAPITGQVASSVASNLTYSVTISYYVVNPRGENTTWLAPYNVTTAPNGNAMACVSGFGVDLPKSYNGTAQLVPKYARITSVGSDSRGSRTVTSTYYLQVTGSRVAGGVIYVYPNNSDYCMDAGSSLPTVGTPVLLQPCVSATSPVAQQAFLYASDLTIRLMSSISAANPNGLCVAGQSAGESPGQALTMQPCSPLGQAPWYEIWSFVDNAHLQGSKTDKSDVNTLCVDVAAQSANTAVKLQTCDGGGFTDTRESWVPTPNFGAGQSGPTTNQWVNQQQYGRCLHDTLFETNYQYMIAYTCKQNPNPNTTIRWNQVWVRNGAGQIVLTVPNPNTESNSAPGQYCLKSPGTTGTSAWPTLGSCSGVPANTVWTYYGATDSSGNPVPTNQQYTIEDYKGDCLSLDTNSQDLYSGQYSPVIMQTCNGNSIEQWNVPLQYQAPDLTDFGQN